MGILQRYILREYLKIFLMSLGTLVLIYLTIDFFEKIRRFVEHGADPLPILTFFLLKLPRILFEMIPLAFLFTTVLALGYFSKTHEITAIKASGISLLKALSPLLILGLVVGLTLLLANQSLIATANRQSKIVRQTQIEKKPQEVYFKQHQVWLRLDAQTLFHVQLLDPAQQAMYGVRIYRLNKDFAIEETVEAKELRYRDGQWVLIDGLKRTFQPDQTLQTDEFETLPLALDRRPEDFSRGMLREDEMTYRELNEYQDKLSEAGFTAKRYQVELATRLALPFASLIMILVGIPSALLGRTKAGVAKGIGLCLVIAMAYWFVFSLSVALGRGGVLPPLLAAWMANFTFAGIGAYLFFWVRQ